MANIDDRRDELAALARLVTYARGCAELIQAKDVEERLIYTLDAIQSELGLPHDTSLAETGGQSKNPTTLQ